MRPMGRGTANTVAFPAHHVIVCGRNFRPNTATFACPRQIQFDARPRGVNNAAVPSRATATTLTTPALAVMCATTFISVTNASMSSIALPDIARDFDVAPDTLSWVVTAYLIPFATGTIVYGRLADMFGTRRMYLFGLMLFTVSCFATAAAPNFPLLILGRVVMAMGGTAVPALSLATIIRTTAPIDRGAANGATIMSVGLGFALGPILGGALVELGGWRGPFLAIGFSSVALLPIAYRFVPGVPGTPGQRFDVIGALATVLGVTGVVIAVNRLPTSPSDPWGIGGLLASVPLFAVLAWRVAKAREPFVNREVAVNGRFWALAVVGAAAQGSHFAVIVLIPLLLASHFDLGTVEIGLYLLPGALAIAVLGTVGGRAFNRLGARPLLLGGGALMLAGGLLFHLRGAGWGPAPVAAIYVVIAAGYGMLQGAMVTAATGALPERLAGVGAGAFNLVFFLGGAVAVALQGAILRRRDAATEAWDPLFNGTPVAYSDALVVVVGMCLIGLLLALRFAPRKAPREVLPPGVGAARR